MLYKSPSLSCDCANTNGYVTRTALPFMALLEPDFTPNDCFNIPYGKLTVYLAITSHYHAYVLDDLGKRWSFRPFLSQTRKLQTKILLSNCL